MKKGDWDDYVSPEVTINTLAASFVMANAWNLPTDSPDYKDLLKDKDRIVPKNLVERFDRVVEAKTSRMLDGKTQIAL